MKAVLVGVALLALAGGASSFFRVVRCGVVEMECCSASDWWAEASGVEVWQMVAGLVGGLAGWAVGTAGA